MNPVQIGSIIGGKLNPIICNNIPKLRILSKISFVRYNSNRTTQSEPQNCKESNGEERNMKYKSVIDFMQEEPEFVKRLNTDYAQPYADISGLPEFFNNSKTRKSSKSPLVDFYQKAKILKPAVDVHYIKNNLEKVQKNVEIRKSHIDVVKEVLEPYKRMKVLEKEVAKYVEMQRSIKEQVLNLDDMNFDGLTLEKKKEKLAQSLNYANNILLILNWIKRQVENFFLTNALMIPNHTYPGVEDSENGEVLETVGNKPEFQHQVGDHIYIGQRLKLFRQDRMSDLAGHRNYFLTDDAAELEQALIQFTLNKLRSKNFRFISTPNILKDAMLEGAGVVPAKKDDILYSVDNASADGFCLAGTSEIGLAAYFSSHSVPISELPLKLCAVSTCYRKETGTRRDPRGLFRVHQFNKVEMFGVTSCESGTESEQLHFEFVEVQKEIFSDLNLHYKLIDMPPNDLGLPAFRKIDIEAWFPGRNSYDEISSASNCTDFQSRRLHILYNDHNDYKFAHTVNATACATSRLIIALLENGQRGDKTVRLPDCLAPYMNGKLVLMRDKRRKQMEYIGIKASKKRQRCLADY